MTNESSLPPNPVPQHPGERWTWRLSFVLAALFFVTVTIHLCWGIYFWTKARNNAPKTSLKLSGEAYLACAPGWNTDHESDAAVYNRAAYEALQTGVPRSKEGTFFDHAPVYAYFLAACYWIGGIRLLSIAIPQAIMSGLIGVLLGVAAWRLALQNKRVAVAIAPLLILSSVHLATYVGYVNPCCLLLTLFCAAFLTTTAPLSLRRTVVFVLMIVLGTYTMASYFLVAAAAALWLVLTCWRNQRVLGLVCAAAIVAGAGLKVAFSMGGGSFSREADRGTLWACNNPYYENWGWGRLWDIIMGDPPGPEWRISEAQLRRHAEYLQRVGNDRSKAGYLWIRENPVQYAKLCFIRFRAVMGPVAARMKLANRILSTAWWLAVFPAGFYGLWKHRKVPVSTFAILVILALVSFETLVMADLQPRYRLPMDMMLVTYASVMYAELVVRWFGRRTAGSAAGSTASIAPPGL